jgi:hypothetical protein
MGKWVAGILGAVITAVLSAVLINYFTNKPKPAESNTPTISIEGRVIDASSNRLISGAKILLEGAPRPNEDTSDSEGRFLFQLSRRSNVAHLIVQSSGYQDYRRAISLQENHTEEIRLTLNVQPPIAVRPLLRLPTYSTRPRAVVVGPPSGHR